MSKLASLPTDLLRLIGSQLVPDKIFTFQAGCRRLYRAWPNHVVYQALRRHYLYRRGAFGSENAEHFRKTTFIRHARTDKLYQVAIKNGDLPLLKFLTRAGYQFDKNVVTFCIRWAPTEKKVTLCRYLLSLGYPATGLRWVIWYDTRTDPNALVHSSDKEKLFSLLMNHGLRLTHQTMYDCLITVMLSPCNPQLRLSLLLFGTEVIGNLDSKVTKSGPFLQFLLTGNIRKGQRLIKSYLAKTGAVRDTDLASQLLHTAIRLQDGNNPPMT